MKTAAPALVPGSTQGMGLATAQALARARADGVALPVDGGSTAQ